MTSRQPWESGQRLGEPEVICTKDQADEITKGLSRVEPLAGHGRIVTVGMDRKRRDLEELRRTIKADLESGIWEC